MNKSEFERKLGNIPEVTADERDAEAIKRIIERNDEVTAKHGKMMNEFGYSGKISLRVPKSLHKALAEGAKEEGISLNQFILYKLAK